MESLVKRTIGEAQIGDTLSNTESDDNRHRR